MVKVVQKMTSGFLVRTFPPHTSQYITTNPLTNNKGQLTGTSMNSSEAKRMFSGVIGLLDGVTSETSELKEVPLEREERSMGIQWHLHIVKTRKFRV